jgi:hypothetical protein
MNAFQNPFLNPYVFGQQYQQIPQSIPATQVVKVSGENGARSYQMGANSSALLLDETGTMVWLATTDGAGYKTVSAYDITPHKTEPVADVSSFEDRLKAVEKRIEEMMNNGNSRNPSANRKKQSDDVEG